MQGTIATKDGKVSVAVRFDRHGHSFAVTPYEGTTGGTTEWIIIHAASGRAVTSKFFLPAWPTKATARPVAEDMLHLTRESMSEAQFQRLLNPGDKQ